MSVSGRRQQPLSWAIAKRLYIVISGLLVGSLLTSIFPATAFAAGQLTLRSLTLQANGTNGGSAPAVSVKHQFTFTTATSSLIGSIKFQYCTTAGTGTCTTPGGLATSFASTTLTNQSGTGGTGFSATSTSMATSGAPYITRTAATINSGVALTYQLTGVTNPTAANTTFYVRISTYASTDTSGTAVDQGTVAASTANPIVLTGTMPESLIFCTGATVGTTAGVPDCSTASSGSILFNQLFSPTDTATANSQMAASTNATSGYVITVNGTTLTSGSNTIPAITTSGGGGGTRGTGQFGMNLAVNTTATSTPAVPSTGVALAPTSNGTNYKANAQTGYATADAFKFVSGDTVAKSDNGSAGSPGATDSQIYTASYIVNVSGSQPAGTYVTTVTYICTPTF